MMTFTLDPERLFWWLAAVGLVLAAMALWADAGVGLARLILDLDQQNGVRKLPQTKKQQSAPTA